MQQNNGMSRAAAMAYRVLIRRGVSALPVHPLEILSACRNTVVWADVTAAEQLKIPREVLLRQLANAEAITFRQTIQEETHFIVVYREGGNPARLRFTLAHELGHRLLHRGDEPNMEREADCFASHLLCPRPTLGRLCARENTFSVEQAAVLAYVSASALQRLSRVEELVVSPEILSAADDLLADWAQRVPLPPQRPGAASAANPNEIPPQSVKTLPKRENDAVLRQITFGRPQKSQKNRKNLQKTS